MAQYVTNEQARFKSLYDFSRPCFAFISFIKYPQRSMGELIYRESIFLFSQITSIPLELSSG